MAECYDGSYHTVDSSDIAFQLAGSLAFHKIVPRASPVLLEPILEVAVTTPDEYVGDVMGDLTQRRGKVLGMEPERAKTTIRAHVPEAELYKYAASLRATDAGPRVPHAQAPATSRCPSTGAEDHRAARRRRRKRRTLSSGQGDKGSGGVGERVVN